MLITFRSQASGDVMMFGEVAKQMLAIVGKEPLDKGIITVAQLPAAIAALKAAIAADKAGGGGHAAPGQANTATTADDQELFVSSSQRAQPLLEQFEWSLKAEKPVLWDT